MIPLGDDNSLRKTTPVITYLIIVLNIVIFLIEISKGENFIDKWAFVPSRFISHPFSESFTLFSSMFMHAGWGHLIGNMLYLWIFGDNVEDRFGPIKYLFFYLFCGIGATFAQMTADPGSSVPNLGASGAIAGVLGGYILMFPKSKINVALGASVTQLPSLIVIGFWFLLQFFSTFESSHEVGSQHEAGGVAYLAHIGGFITGLVATIFFQALERKKM